MSDTPNPLDLYAQLLGQYQDTSKNPATRQKGQLSYASQLKSLLGFDPLNYKPTNEIPYAAPESAVKLQYANDPVVSAALEDIASGAENSASLAAQYIDPSTGGLTEAAQKAGVTQAQAQNVVDASKAFEAEQAKNTVDQKLYEQRQQNDPTFGRTKGSDPTLGAGDLGGTVMPQVGYSQGLLDLIQGLDTTPSVSNPTTPLHAQPKPRQQVSVYDQNIGGKPQLTMDPRIHPNNAAQRVSDTVHGTVPRMTDILPAPLPQGQGFRNLLDVVRGGTLPQQGPSAQDRAVQALQGNQLFAQKMMRPVANEATQNAVQRLLQVQALLGR